MAFDADNEILQDFLIEASEILEKLGEQLVELEHRSDDKELLNAVFRGFHTVKGGAGFLNITYLVEVCHAAEDVFNTLRQGLRAVDAGLMDTVLRVTDVVNAMMDAVRNGNEPEPADPKLIAELKILSQPKQSGEIVEASSNSASVLKSADSGSSGKDVVEEMFEDMLANSGDAKQTPSEAESHQPDSDAVNISASNDTITDEEFEALLDQLHGKGGHSGIPNTSEPQKGESEDKKGAAAQKASEAPLEKPSDQPSQKSAAVKETAPQQQADTTVRVDTKRLDDIMNLVGELVLVRNRLQTLKINMGNDQVAQAVSNLDLVTSDLQAAVMKTRMQPIKKVFGRFPRVVRDLSRTLNKEINLELIGEDTDLDKNLVEALADPLVHLVRNSIDHGIEMPDVRQSAGKDRVGTIILSAKQEGDHILLQIKDDGAGMNADRLRNKAIEKGLLDADAANRLDVRDCYNLIFMPGFSTKSEISDISGRGVGMDVVKTRITQLNGSVEIDSEEGKGTEIIIKLPLTLAIVPTLMVMVGTQIFAIPLANVSEIIHLDSVRKNVVDGQSVAIIREHPLPLFFLRNWLLHRKDEKSSLTAGYIVVIKNGASQVACVVDHLIAQEEVVIKPLGALLQGLPGLAGATITGDGRIAIILDMPSLIARYARRTR